jgi:hypothetical protein
MCGSVLHRVRAWNPVLRQAFCRKSLAPAISPRRIETCPTNRLVVTFCLPCSFSPLAPALHKRVEAELVRVAAAVAVLQAARALQAPGPVVHRRPLPRPGHPPALKHRPYTRPDNR